MRYAFWKTSNCLPCILHCLKGLSIVVPCARYVCPSFASNLRASFDLPVIPSLYGSGAMPCDACMAACHLCHDNMQLHVFS